jgi:integrase
MLTDIKLKSLKPRESGYKVADRDGLYVMVKPSGSLIFRFDYRYHGRRETLTIGRYGDGGITLAEARDNGNDARRKLRTGISPAREKADGKRRLTEAQTFAAHSGVWMRDAGMAESTKAMRKAILDRDVLPALGKRYLEEIRPSELMALFDKIKARGAPATALHAREIVGQVYRHASARGLRITNPTDSIKPSAIATFKPRDRALTPDEIRAFFNTLDAVGSLPTIKLAIKQIVLTLCRKGELLQAKWAEIDFEKATWTIPAERMKAGRPHVIYLSAQALDIMIALKTCAGSSDYVLPGRYDLDKPMSDATLNRVITATVEKARKAGETLDEFSVHDLRRTGSTLLHELGFNSDWIEKCLAHEQRGVRAVYNKAEYADQRRKMLQSWADMVDGWINNAKVVPLRKMAA